ncbi:MAG TPA: hypothetical protein PKZ17_07465 [Thermodesulfovibrio thiophilus]|nr:hypothetical protein [Thermodesulfovibrio thiophilus]HHW21090.1 hypothetical protein [Thermodesulfovibrio thiophilus]HQA04552.1 hypothetical protein [Thermodesulfovibrio thiophilus]
MPEIGKMTKLEEALEEFIISVGIEFHKSYNCKLRTESEKQSIFLKD